MDALNVEKGKKIIKAGEKVKHMYVVYRGSFRQTDGNVVITLGPGTVLGLSDSLNEVYSSDYVALEDSAVYVCDYSGIESFRKVFKDQPVYIFGFSKGAFRQCRDIFAVYDEKMDLVQELYEFAAGTYQEYKFLCEELGCEPKVLTEMEELVEFDSPEKIEQWEHDYIDCLNTVENKEIENIYGKREEVVLGIIGTCCGYIKRAVSAVDYAQSYLDECSHVILNEEGLDLLFIVFELKVFAAQRGLPTDEVDDLASMMYDFCKDSGLYTKELIISRFKKYQEHDYAAEAKAFEEAEERASLQFADAFGTICDFAGIEQEKKEAYRADINEYLALSDRESKDDKPRRIRKKATDAFYEIYEKAFLESLNHKYVEPVLKMFFNFGFIDASAMDGVFAEQLLELVEKIDEIQNDHVFTIYNWLKAIYEGRREPSKNELDLDYRGFIIEERKSGNITEDKVSEWMNNQEEKVKFEIHNFFKSSNRTTSGKMTSFCPILTGDGFGAEIERMLLNATRLQEAVGKIEKIDFGIFYRELYFTDMGAGINSAPYPKRIEPDFILLPNTGARAMMWQECGGVHVDTPARFVFPLFTMEDIDKLMLYCCGAFRWEVCRREQGAHWNDITSQCLTSDFYDYFTFYKKNKDLTAEQKEKVKSLLKSSRNNMREAFAKQYAVWLNFESNGSVRLNKTEREILGKYCPFAKSYREALAAHPMFEQSISRYAIKNAQALTHIQAVFDKYEKAGHVVPEDVKAGIEYYKL